MHVAPLRLTFVVVPVPSVVELDALLFAFYNLAEVIQRLFKILRMDMLLPLRNGESFSWQKIAIKVIDKIVAQHIAHHVV